MDMNKLSAGVARNPIFLCGSPYFRSRGFDFVAACGGSPLQILQGILKATRERRTAAGSDEVKSATTKAGRSASILGKVACMEVEAKSAKNLSRKQTSGGL